jgi:hypothetical protein
VRCSPKLATLGRVAALAAAFIVLDVWGLAAPAYFSGDGGNFNAQALARDRTTAPENEAARLEQSQQALLRAEVARIGPPNKGATNVYAIGIAGWANQDVFIRELDGGLAVFDRILPTRNHTVRLVNGRDTGKTLPLASQRNFAAAVHAVGAAMDKNADVLLLLMTSHGDRRGFLLRLPTRPPPN